MTAISLVPKVTLGQTNQHMAQIDIIFEDPRWKDHGLTELASAASGAVFRALDVPAEFEISLLACDDARIAALNEDFRAMPAPTNVLSWPSEDRAPDTAGQTPTPPTGPDPELGDIAIAYDTCAREAAEQGKDFNDHVTHLLVHGVLHLLGYDHIDDRDAALMEGLETRILAKLGIEDPY